LRRRHPKRWTEAEFESDVAVAKSTFRHERLLEPLDLYNQFFTGDHMTIPFERLKVRLLANPKVKAEYDALAAEFEISAELIKARLRAGLSQAELAARMGTSQSSIARLESGQTLPSTKTLLRYAEATGSKFRVRLSAA
jgi:DNA-binding XRE family transcriptional regulator